jgi:hypothetical protein
MSREFKKTFNKNEMVSRNREIEINIRSQNREAKLDKRRLVSEDDKETVSLFSITDLTTLHAALLTISNPPAPQQATDHFSSLVRLRRSLAVDSEEADCLKEALFDHGIIPTLAQLAGTSESALALEALGCLCHLAEDSSSAVRAMLPAAPFLIARLNDPSASMCERAALTLGNMAGDGLETKQHLLALGVLQPLLVPLQADLLSSTSTPGTISSPQSLAVGAAASWALGTILKQLPEATMRAALRLPVLTTVLSLVARLSRVLACSNHSSSGTPSAVFSLSSAGIVTTNFANVTLNTQLELLRVELAWCLAHITASPAAFPIDNANSSMALWGDAVPLLADALARAHGHPALQFPLLRCLGNLTAADPALALSLARLEALPPALLQCLGVSLPAVTDSGLFLFSPEVKEAVSHRAVVKETGSH